MRLIFDFDTIPNEEDVGVIVDAVKAAQSGADPHEVHLQVNGKGPSFTLGEDIVSSAEKLGIDVIKEVVSAIVIEMRTELENGSVDTD